jgi:hypothetical protein
MPESWNFPVSSTTPALDFLRRVEIWQQAAGGTAGIAVPMPEGDDATLASILNQVRTAGGTTRLEAQARNWLIGYREMQPPLTPSQAAQLGAVIDGMPSTEQAIQQSPEWRFPRPSRVVQVILAVAVAALIALGGVYLLIGSQPDNSVQQGSQSQQHQAPQQVPPGSTDLQNFESDWGPFRQLAVSDQGPQTGAPALLLLNQGGYYQAKNWALPGNAGWTADLGGNVQSVEVISHHADITDADGNLWVIGINQPFVFAGNPGTVLKIDPIGTVLAIPESHAIATRTHI